MVRLMNSFMGIVFATGAFEFDIADTETNAKSADKLRFVWVDGIPDDFVLGEIAAMAKVNGVYPVRISGYWYGKRGRDGKHAQRASPGEKVIYFMHGKSSRPMLPLESQLKHSILGGGHVVCR